MTSLLANYRRKKYRQRVLNMDDLEYMRSLSELGTYEDLTKIIAYLTSKCLMTPDKLQGLLWYAYAWGLVLLNTEIAPLIFIRTPYGPAELNVNHLYPVWDTAIIPQTAPPILNPNIQKLLDAVIDRYGSVPNEVLSAKYANHCNNVPDGEEISARNVYLYFSAATL